MIIKDSFQNPRADLSCDNFQSAVPSWNFSLWVADVRILVCVCVCVCARESNTNKSKTYDAEFRKFLFGLAKCLEKR